MHLLWLSVALHIEYFSSILPPLQDIYHAVLKISAKSQNKKVLLERQRYHNLAWSSLSSSSFSTDPSSDLAPGKIDQTWVLSKILRCRILQRQFHQISTILGKNHKKMSENGEIYTAGKNFTLPPALTAWTNSTSGVFSNSLSQAGVQEYFLIHCHTQLSRTIF